VSWKFVNGNVKPVICDIQRKGRTHCAKTNQADICFCHVRMLLGGIHLQHM